MEIHPEKQNIDNVFSHLNYYHDFYQREYKWTKPQVLSLLDDIFDKFSTDYKKNCDLEASSKNIERVYSWYYLSTYITNSESGKMYIVDGQQRLTTIALMLIKLYHMCEVNNSPHKGWVEAKILGHSGTGPNFWLAESDRIPIFKALYDDSLQGVEKTVDDISVKNMMANHKLISDFLDQNLKTPHKLNTFIIYLLRRVVLINLQVEQTDVPMVFEVINDRGERLRPYEILKGKMLGQIPKADVREFDKIWREKIKPLAAGEKDLVDDFFRAYFKAKFTITRVEGRKLDGDYHKVIFSHDFNSKLQLKKNVNRVKDFVKEEFSYYVDLYKKIRLRYMSKFDKEQPYVFFNYLNEMDSQIMLILAACDLRDKEEERKIQEVSRLVDKMYVSLYLNKSYDSNDFIDAAYELNGVLREAKIDDYQNIFDSVIISCTNEKRNANIDSPLQYSYFKEVGYQDLRKTFLRYFLTRIEFFLSQAIQLEMQNAFTNYVRSTGATTGYHIDHVLARNKENLANFDNDEELFEKERNRLAGLFLLKGKDNLSSGNETYEQKLRTYSSANFWNQTLLDDFYKSNLDFTNFVKQSGLPFKPINRFNKEALESRSKLLFDIVKGIWE